jgi:hypothetical protein
VKLEFGPVAERCEPENLKLFQFEQRLLLGGIGRPHPSSVIPSGVEGPCVWSALTN